ncbi:MAG: site-specific integrase [Myxococcota bacterium]|jgi:integrase|nr:site-specific integrase [Myxococcota bacterium]
MGGKTGRPRKHPQPSGLDDNIYWRPGTDPKIGSFHVAYTDPVTKTGTTRVIKKKVPKSQLRNPALIDEVNRLAAREVEEHTGQPFIVSHDMTVRFAWEDFIENKRNRRNKPLQPSTKQDYQSMYEHYILGAFTTSSRPSRKGKTRRREKSFYQMTEEEKASLDPKKLRQLERRQNKGLANLTLKEMGTVWVDKDHPHGASRIQRWQEWMDTRAWQGDGPEPDREQREKLGLISLKRRANVLALMSSFLGYCYKKKWTPTNLGKEIEVPAGTDPDFKVPEYEKLMELLRALSGQDRVFVELALYSGLRAGELAALDWEDIDYKNQVIKVRRSFTHGAMSDTTKGGKPRRVPLHDRIIRLLKNWEKDCPSDTIVFPTKRYPTDGTTPDVEKRMSVDSFRQRVWKPTTKSVGLDGVRIHDLRHSYVTWLVSLNINPFLISAAAGHQDPRTTRIYLDLDPKLYKSVRDAFNAPKRKEGQPADLTDAEIAALARPPKENATGVQPKTSPKPKPGGGIRIVGGKAKPPRRS